LVYCQLSPPPSVSTCIWPDCLLLFHPTCLLPFSGNSAVLLGNLVLSCLSV
jgi:hypothetical protein